MTNNKPFKVLVVAEPWGATQHISFTTPLSLPEANIKLTPEFKQTGINDPSVRLNKFNPDLVVLSRINSSAGVRWSAEVRKRGLPVVFHIDDALLDVPESLGAKKFAEYNDANARAALVANINSSDLIYCSTRALGARFEDIGFVPPIISGAVYATVEPKRVGTSLPPASEPVIGYMGTGGHVEDLAAIIPVIERLLEERPALSFELFGSLEMPFELMRFGDRVRKLPFMKSYEEFTETLANLGWWVGLAPLVDNVFNGCKADTKWVEYASAGIPVVASNTPVYDYACQGGAGLMADGPAGWYQAINMLLDNHQMRADQTAKADAHLRANYSHQRLLAQVEHVFAAAQHLAKQRKVRDGQASMAFAGGQTT